MWWIPSSFMRLLSPPPTVAAKRLEASEIGERRHHGCVVGARRRATSARVLGDGRQRLLDDGFDGDRVEGLHERGGDEDVVDELLLSLEDARVVLAVGHE